MAGQSVAGEEEDGGGLIVVWNHSQPPSLLSVMLQLLSSPQSPVNSSHGDSGPAAHTGER